MRLHSFRQSSRALLFLLSWQLVLLNDRVVSFITTPFSWSFFWKRSIFSINSIFHVFHSKLLSFSNVLSSKEKTWIAINVFSIFLNNTWRSFKERTYNLWSIVTTIQSSLNSIHMSCDDVLRLIGFWCYLISKLFILNWLMDVWRKFCIFSWAFRSFRSRSFLRTTFRATSILFSC